MFPERGDTDPWQSGFEEQSGQHDASPPSNPLNTTSPSGEMLGYHASRNAYGTRPNSFAGIPASNQIQHVQQRLQGGHSQLPVVHLHGHPAQSMAASQGMQRVLQPRDIGGIPIVASTSTMTPQAALSNQRMVPNQYGPIQAQPSALQSISEYEGPGSYPRPVDQQLRGVKRTIEDDEVNDRPSQTNLSMFRTLSSNDANSHGAPKLVPAHNNVAQHPESGSDQPTSLAKSKITLTDLKSNVGVMSLGADDFDLRFDSADDASAVAYPRIKLNLEEDDVDHVEAHPEEYIRSIIRAINYDGYLEPQALDKQEGLSDVFVKAWKKWQLSSHEKVQKILRGEDRKYHILERKNIQEEVEALACMMVQAFIDASKIGCRRTIFREDITSKCTQRLETATIMLASYSIMRLDFLKEMKFDHFAANPEKFTATKTQSMKSNWKRWVSKNGHGTKGDDAQDQDKAAVEAQVEADAEAEADHANNASVDEDEVPPKKRRKSSNKSKQPKRRGRVSGKKTSSTAGE